MLAQSHKKETFMLQAENVIVYVIPDVKSPRKHFRLCNTFFYVFRRMCRPYFK